MRDILADANQALGGNGLPGYVSSFGDLNNLVEALNLAFDNCIVSAFAQAYLCKPVSPAPSLHQEGIDIKAFTKSLIAAERLNAPRQTRVLRNYPNPFNPETWIPFELKESANVTLRIYNAAGSLVRTIDLGREEAGYYISKDRAVYWNGRNENNEPVSSGIYFYTLQAGEFTATEKMLLLK